MRRQRELLLFPWAAVLMALAVSAPTGAQPLAIRYTFDEGSGNALDTGAAPAADGVLQPNATRTTDTPGGASAFALDLSAEGVESFVNAGDSAKVDALTSFTMTTWLKLEGLNTDQGGSRNVRLLAKQGPGPDFNGFSWNLNDPNLGDREPDNFRLGMFIGGEFGFGFSQSNEDVGAADRWTFLAVTYNGNESTDNLEFYWGDETTAVMPLGDPGSLDVGQVASTAGEADFGIGMTDAAPGIDFAAFGLQDDVRIYSEVLSQEQLDQVRLENLGGSPALRAGDADQDLDFDQFDLIQVQQRAKYLTGQPATWGDGDWNGAPGGQVGQPPAGNSQFDQLDIIAALSAATYLTGPYAAIEPGGAEADGQTSVGYDARTGRLWVDAPTGQQLTSINIDSAAGILTGDTAENLGGSFDHDADDNIFKATFGASFGSIRFGSVAQPGLDRDFVVRDLSVVGSLAGGGGLGPVDLIYLPVPEPPTALLLCLALAGVRWRKSS